MTVDLIIPLDPPVAGISALHVVAVQAQQLAPKHVSWLAAGWACVPKDAAVEALAEALNLGDGAAAATTGGAAASSSGTAGKGGKTVGKGKAAAAAANRRAGAAAAAPKLWPLPKVLGFDTEFVGDQLAVVQLCAGPHVLLVQVPSCRQPASEQQQQQTKEKAQGGKEQPPWRAPFTLLPELKALLCNPCIPKAAAEAWQDALMVYMGFGEYVPVRLMSEHAISVGERVAVRMDKCLLLFSSLYRNPHVAAAPFFTHTHMHPATGPLLKHTSRV